MPTMGERKAAADLARYPVTLRSFDAPMRGGRWNTRRLHRHTYTAESGPDEKITVRDSEGRPVPVRVTVEPGGRTAYVSLQAPGPSEPPILGGWRYPHIAQNQARLVEAVNLGFAYQAVNDLPTKSGPEKYSLNVEALIELANVLANEPGLASEIAPLADRVLERMNRRTKR